MEGRVKVGFLVNPIAGMGGAVGLKGTDGDDAVSEAMARGARRIASIRAAEALSEIDDRKMSLEVLTCSEDMGEHAFAHLDLPFQVVYKTRARTTANDSRLASRAFIDHGVDLIIFVGGDGTARDILSEVGQEVPIIGVPSGVKMHSAVFANTPRELADVVQDFSVDGQTEDAEVLDVDESSFREGVLRARLFGVARVPTSAGHVQAGKQEYSSGTATQEAEELGHYIKDIMEPDCDYIIGPGSTTSSIAVAMGQEKTLLGVDVFRDHTMVVRDAAESDLLRRLEAVDCARIIVSPIGAQGFIFGRGNQQISPRVIRRVGISNVIVVSTPSKLAKTMILRVDTGDRDLDDGFAGTAKVVTGYKRRKLVSVA
jgi:predicted polyphosphate/ATP-dependent NAD kinase